MQKIITHALLVLFLTPLLGGCAKSVLPTPELPTRSVQKMPDITYDTTTGEYVTTLTVLAYNVMGLPWPAREGRRSYLREIGDFLGKMRREGRAPDVILLQEGFMDTTLDLINTSGYRNVVPGPDRTDKAIEIINERTRAYEKGLYPWKGEGWGKLYHSGLYILSQYPIINRHTHAFRFCAGWDCLANKGIVAAEVRLPRLPDAILLVNTHMQAGASAGVPVERTNKAHMLQIDEAKDFIKDLPRKNMPLIFGGDFNMRNKNSRVLHGLRTIKAREPHMLVRHYCTDIVLTCDIAMPLEAEVEPWRYTQNLQGFIPGPKLDVRPIRMEKVFDGSDKNNPVLSNHDGYMVTYELRWKEEHDPYGLPKKPHTATKAKAVGGQP